MQVECGLLSGGNFSIGTLTEVGEVNVRVSPAGAASSAIVRTDVRRLPTTLSQPWVWGGEHEV